MNGPESAPLPEAIGSIVREYMKTLRVEPCGCASLRRVASQLRLKSARTNGSQRAKTGESIRRGVFV
jgi:hypothetical protein